MSELDRRVTVFRPDLADARLRGKVEAERFVEGAPARVAIPVADMLSEPVEGAGLGTQLLFGDEVLVFERSNGFAWVQAVRDSYVGYVALSALAEEMAAPTHIVSVPRTFLYPGPDLKRPRREALSLASSVRVVDFVENRGTRYAMLGGGAFIIASHLAPLADKAADYVSVAETLLFTPYLWGGASAFGIDCSGLVQLSMNMAGKMVLRDTDMQAGSIGDAFAPGEDLSGLRRGDLVFWKGHVGIMADAENLLHANGHTMMVSREKLHDAVARIGYLYDKPTAFRRP
ncbi:MAG TPA: NlpC/P60 family protein [Rhizobiaceae bacterium]|nr:NlpC/P60 family protein [Rhizobiaceae bacterium]